MIVLRFQIKKKKPLESKGRQLLNTSVKMSRTMGHTGLPKSHLQSRS